MNYLALVRRLAQEMNAELYGNISGVAVTPPGSYGSSTEHIRRLVDWIAQAWLEIQNDQPEWLFMQGNVSIPLTLGQSEYDVSALANTEIGSTAFDEIIPYTAGVESRYIWAVDTNQSPNQKFKCYYIPHELFMGELDRFTAPVGNPSAYTVKPDGTLVLRESPPAANWTLNFQYRKLPQTLAVDADTPTGLPDKFHMLIVYWAMVEHAEFDEGDKQARRGWRNYRRMLNKLRLEQLPDWTVPGTR